MELLELPKIHVTDTEFRSIAMGRPNIKKEIDSYLFIQNKFENDSIDDDFIKAYKWFYKLDSAGLGNEIKDRNFALIQDRVTDLREILSEIYDIPTIRGYHTIQLSFATKIIHTVDNNKPIYDANVSRLLGLAKVIPSGNSKESRIDSAMKVYDELQEKTNQIINSPVGENLISYFYSLEIPGVRNIPKTKAIDFCFWILGA